jgi:hypothetical protein
MKSIRLTDINNSVFPLINNNKQNTDTPGLYFLLSKINKDTYNIIYVGKSDTSIKQRLDDHWKKFQPNGKWYNWKNINIESNNDIYYWFYPSIFGASFEEMLLYGHIDDINFCLNTTLNGHTYLIDLENIKNWINLSSDAFKRLFDVYIVKLQEIAKKLNSSILS